MKLSSISGTKKNIENEDYENNIFTVKNATYTIERFSIDYKSSTIIIKIKPGKKDIKGKFIPLGETETFTLKDIKGGFSRINEYLEVQENGNLQLSYPIHQTCVVYFEKETIDFEKISNSIIKVDDLYSSTKLLVRYGVYIKEEKYFSEFMQEMCLKNTFNYNLIECTKKIINKKK